MNEREKIGEQAYYTYIPGDFKKSRVSAVLRFPLEREGLTASALLPLLLERGTEKCPDVTQLRRALDMLYGASVRAASASMDFSRYVVVSSDGIDDAFLPEDPGVSERRAALLLDMLLAPNAPRGEFPKELVDIERGKLREVIESEINDKRMYCLRLASELFFGADERALAQNGYTQDLDAIDGKSLYEVYRAILSKATIDVFVIGPGEGRIKEQFRSALAGLSRRPSALKKSAGVPKGPVREAIKRFDVEQDKLALVYTAGRLLTEDEQTALTAATALFGGAPTSRLFLNVREKQSLCYYCACRAGLMSGSMTIDSGIAHGDAKKAEDAIARELETVCGEAPQEKELDEIKRYLKSAYASVGNSPDASFAWYLNSLIRLGRYVTPQEQTERILSLKTGEISDVLGLFELSARCLITEKENG